MEPPGRGVWKAIRHPELELKRVERGIDLGVIFTKVKVKALGMDEISICQRAWREKNLE